MADSPIVWEQLSQPIQRRYLVIAAISQQKLSLHGLNAKTGIPVSTLSRTLRSLRSEFGMDVRYVNTTVSNSYGKDGYYHIEDWGVVNQQFFLEKMTSTVPI